jgi:hypothetical protein
MFSDANAVFATAARPTLPQRQRIAAKNGRTALRPENIASQTAASTIQPTSRPDHPSRDHRDHHRPRTWLVFPDGTGRKHVQSAQRRERERRASERRAFLSDPSLTVSVDVRHH